jgi:hypothetical protein
MTPDEIRRKIHEMFKRHLEAGTKTYSVAELNTLLSEFQQAVMREYYAS